MILVHMSCTREALQLPRTPEMGWVVYKMIHIYIYYVIIQGEESKGIGKNKKTHNNEPSNCRRSMTKMINIARVTEAYVAFRFTP